MKTLVLSTQDWTRHPKEVKEEQLKPPAIQYSNSVYGGGERERERGGKRAHGYRDRSVWGMPKPNH